MTFKPGDRVRVVDEGLMQLNKIMGIPESESTNNVGTVSEDTDIYTDSGSVLINFDEGGSSPYPIESVRKEKE